MVRDSREPLTDFGRALAEEDGRIAAHWGPEYHYRRRGFYHSQLERYFERFGRDQVRVYLYDDLRSDPVGVARNIFRFPGGGRVVRAGHDAGVQCLRCPEEQSPAVLYLFLRGSNPLKSALKPLLPAKLRRRLYARHRERAEPQPRQTAPHVAGVAAGAHRDLPGGRLEATGSHPEGSLRVAGVTVCGGLYR